MKIYWSATDMPELASLPPKQRQKIVKTCTQKYAFKHWQTWASLLVVGVLGAVGGKYAGVIGGAVAAGIGGGVTSIVVNTVVHPHVKEYAERELKS